MRGRLLLAGVALAGLAVLGSPFSFADGNSGRYLPALYRQLDPGLFPGDVVTDAFGRFSSAFYGGAAMALGAAHVQPLGVEGVFFALFVLSKIALIGLLFRLVRSLGQGAGAFVLLAAWAVHQKAAPVGGDSMFAPSMTHATVAVLLGIAAVSSVARGRVLWFSVLLSSALFVHSIIAFQLALMMWPILLWRDRGRMPAETLAGAALFAIAFLGYWLWMTPPAFTSEEAELFLGAKGTMVHIAPQAQSTLDWIKMVGRVLLALLAYRLFFDRHSALGLLAGAIIVGSLLAPAIGLVATSGHSVPLTQLQPMRMFEWVNFFAFVLIASAVPAAWDSDRPLAIVLLIVILLNILDSLWGIPWLYFAIAGCLVRSKRVLFAGSLLLTVAAIVMLMPGGSHSLESLREPLPVLVLIVCFVLFKPGPGIDSWRWPVAVAALALALAGRTVYVQGYVAERQDLDYQAACRWVALNTPKDARFITAVSDRSGGNFRARALRTSVNEAQSALFWVAPLVARENARMAGQVEQAFDGRGWDTGQLQLLARQWGAAYILFQGPADAVTPVFQQGSYRIVSVP